MRAGAKTLWTAARTCPAPDRPRLPSPPTAAAHGRSSFAISEGRVRPAGSSVRASAVVAPAAFQEPVRPALRRYREENRRRVLTPRFRGVYNRASLLLKHRSRCGRPDRLLLFKNLTTDRCGCWVCLGTWWRLGSGCEAGVWGLLGSHEKHKVLTLDATQLCPARVGWSASSGLCWFFGAGTGWGQRRLRETLQEIELFN